MQIKEMIQECKDKQLMHMEHVEKYRLAIEAIQNVCEHDFHYEGHGHNEEYHTCTICGFEKTS